MWRFTDTGGEHAAYVGAMKDLRRILVGFDERPASRDALALGKALSETAEAELIEPSVRPSWPETIDPDGLKEIAAAENADLIVLGSTDGGPLLGTFGERVLNDAPCAVAIAPFGLADAEFRLRRIAIAYDGSKEAGVALDLAIELARRSGAPLLILGAVEIEINVTGFGPDTLEAVEVARMRRHLDRARARVPDSLAVEARLLHGTPSHVLAEAAEESDLLLLGSRGHYGPARRLFLGSLATQVTRHAPCATLITPAA